MFREERWKIYFEVHQLKQLGLKVAQIARKTGVSRETVYKYLSDTGGISKVFGGDGYQEKETGSTSWHHCVVAERLSGLISHSGSELVEGRHETIKVSESTVRNCPPAQSDLWDTETEV